MSTREDLSQFETPASRALVDQFMADTADEDNDVDMDEVVRQNLADHEAALTGKLKAKPARPKNPKPVVGYLVTSDPDDYTANTRRGWFFLPPLNCTIKGAQDKRIGFQAMAPASPPKPMYRVTITFERVEDGNDD